MRVQQEEQLVRLVKDAMKMELVNLSAPIPAVRLVLTAPTTTHRVGSPPFLKSLLTSLVVNSVQLWIKELIEENVNQVMI